jgi:hypothetical protein
MSRTDGAAENYLPILACRSEALAKAGAQILFQPGESAGKGSGGAASSRNRGGNVCGRLPPKLRRWPSPGIPIFSTARNPATGWEKVCRFLLRFDTVKIWCILTLLLLQGHGISVNGGVFPI